MKPLYDSEIDLNFKNGAIKTRLENKAPSLTHEHFIDHITSVCESLPCRSPTSKMDKPFSGMMMLYLLNDRTRHDIVRVTNVGRCIIVNLKNLLLFILVSPLFIHLITV